MNLGLILLVLLFLAVFFLIIASLIFYLRHWAARQARSNASAELEGRYFKRYIPEQLRDEYDKKYPAYRHGNNVQYRSRWANMASILIIFIAISIPAYSLIRHLDSYLAPIDLTSAEIARLDYSHHQWQRLIDKQIPSLATILGTMQKREFILPYSSKDDTWLVDGVSLPLESKSMWENFSNEHDFSIRECSWTKLKECLSENRSSILLLLPGYWHFAAIDDSLKDGASVLAFGPPAQVFTSTEKTLDWHGLRFHHVFKKEGGALVLLGDRLLTLGFDAGLILSANSPFMHAQAFAESPQAISIGDTYIAGGKHETRIYAKTVGAGRLVWMDFPPSPEDNGPSINVNHLNAVMAAIFRYLNKQPYTALATWPQARHFAALIEEDTEAKFTNAEKVNQLVEQMSSPITWFMLSNEALKYRELARNLAHSGEVACHGDNHGVFTKSSPRDQEIRIARCQKVLQQITGIRPLAFRPPEEEYDSNTIDAIVNNGMDHYIANHSPDRAVPEIIDSQDNSKSLVSIPRMVSDDFELWYIRNLNHAATLKLVDSEITWMQEVGGIYMFSFHTQFMNKADNLNTVKHIITRIKNLKAYFATSRDIADWWRFRTALQQGKRVANSAYAKFKPVMLVVTTTGELRRYPYVYSDVTLNP